MADFFAKLEDKHKKFILKQVFFTVSTAAQTGRINISPKGLDSFRILDDQTVTYLDLVGSGNETAAHLSNDGRITIMFMSFDRNALILRIYGRGKAVQKNDPEFQSLLNHFADTRGVRQIMKINIESVSTSCGYGVPQMEHAQTRETMMNWIEKKGEKSLNDYQRENNLKSIDGLDTGLWVEDDISLKKE